MKRLPVLALLLMFTLPLVACGESGQSGQASGPEGGQTVPAAGQDETPGTTQGSPTPESTASGDAARESAASESGQSGQGGYSVTTLDGERVSIGSGENVTALFFMAGW